MFGSNGKEMKGPMAVDNNVLNTIARGTVLEGKIVTKGDIRVEGKGARITPARVKNSAKLSEIQAILKHSGPRLAVKDMRVTDYED